MNLASQRVQKSFSQQLLTDSALKIDDVKARCIQENNSRTLEELMLATENESRRDVDREFVEVPVIEKAVKRNPDRYRRIRATSKKIWLIVITILLVGWYLRSIVLPAKIINTVLGEFVDCNYCQRSGLCDVSKITYCHEERLQIDGVYYNMNQTFNGEEL